MEIGNVKGMFGREFAESILFGNINMVWGD